MKRLLLSLLLVTTLSGCASIHMNLAQEEPVALKPRESLFKAIPELDGPPLTIAVYGFSDKTGQMKPNDRLAVFSKAVTQGSEVFLIKALQDAKGWFKVVERVGLDNLIKERQLIRNQREVYEGKDAKPLKPMTVAGIIIEGGIIGYDSNIRSGGNGARFLGIGGSQQYRVDEVVISMRIISVNSGEVLLTNAVSKTIYSTQHNVGVLRFVDAGTNALELENGAALNEPTTYAVRVAIEQAVYDMIVEGEKKGLWRYKKPKLIQPPVAVEEVPKAQPVVEPVVEIKTQPVVETKVEPKVETKVEASVPEVATSSVSTNKKQTGIILDWVNIRSQKFKTSNTLIKLDPGVEVEVINIEQWFVYVKYQDKEGWIPRQFIKVQNNNNSTKERLK
jgi:curli production assembly/transport component CsgG